MDNFGLPIFNDSCQQRSTIVIIFHFQLSLVLGYFRKWQKVIFFLTIPISDHCFFGLFGSVSCLLVELFFELASYRFFYCVLVYCEQSEARVTHASAFTIAYYANCIPAESI